MKRFVLLVLAGLALVGATSSTGSAAGVGRRPLGIVIHHGTQRVNAAHAASTATATAPTSNPTCNGSSCTGYESAIDKYFTDVAADNGNLTNVYSVATQYSSIQYDETFVGSYVDTTAYPTNGCNDGDVQNTWCLTDAQLQTEIRKDITANGWPTETPGNPTSLYFIFTPSNVGVCWDGTAQDCTTNSFCAYHSSTVDSSVIYAVEPYDATISGCNSAPSPNGDDADATINTISHEQNEAITDPYGDAWYSNDAADNYPENGDLCAWNFGTALGSTANGDYNQMINNDKYELQLEFSNAAVPGTGGCVPTLNGLVTTDALLQDGVGPLVDHGGSVMTTNSVYAIYWIPSSSGAPANSALPVVSGTAAVGKALTTSNGSWTGSPTSYAYQWQRCSSSGTSCADISGATSSSYKLVSTDAGHEIRSEVTATNSNGSSRYVASAPTEPVVPVLAAVAAPAVSGVAAVGKTLSTTQGTWNSPASYAYQWLRCSPAGGSCSTISGSTRATYKLASADAGHTIEARVSATNAAGTTVALSAPTPAVIDVPHATGKPQISGRAKVGRILSADPGTWTNSPRSFRYQWLRCSAEGTSCVRIAKAKRSTYKVGRDDAKHRLRVRVTATNAAGSGSATSRTTRTATRR